MSRPVTPIATADSVSVGYLALGKVEPTTHMTLLMDDHEAYRLDVLRCGRRLYALSHPGEGFGEAQPRSLDHGHALG